MSYGHENRWSELARIALQGLRATYRSGGGSLPHSMTWDGSAAHPVGFNVRYALISLLGLGRSQGLGQDNDELVRDLWGRVAASRAAIENSAGDLGLALWSQELTRTKDLFSTEHALKAFRAHRGSFDSVHLAWIMLGADHVLTQTSHGAAEELVGLAKEDLLKLYNSESRLFYRHSKNGPLAGVARRVPCFANQIYPVMALAVHSRRTGCAEASQVGRSVADNLCRLQGPLGQWWWLYDAKTGAVVDGYPVFSVHQDGMAPMALMETTLAGGRSYGKEIERGLNWIFGENELETNLILADEGLVLRDIHVRGVGRIRRALRSAAWCGGLSRGVPRDGRAAVYTINHECRPYHLGWILYAASLMSECQASRVRFTEGAGHAVG